MEYGAGTVMHTTEWAYDITHAGWTTDSQWMLLQ